MTCFIVLGYYSFGIYFLHFLIIDAFHLFYKNSIIFPVYSLSILFTTFFIIFSFSKITKAKFDKIFGFS